MSFLNIWKGVGWATRRPGTPVMMALAGVLALASVLFAPAAAADHGEGHNGETLELSATELSDGDEVTVSLTSWLPGNTATIVTCFVYPVLGPVDCELSNYGQHAVVIGDDGTGTYDYPVAVVPGKCDEAFTCYIVAADGFGLDANYAAQEVSFLATDGEDSAAAEPLQPDPEPEPPRPDPEPPSLDPEPEPPPPEAPSGDNNSGDGNDREGDGEAALDASGGDSGTSALSWLIPAIAIVALVVLGGGFWARRRNRGDGVST